VPPPGELDETGVVFDFGPFDPLSENMASSTEPEVHNVLHYRQRRTEPRPRVTCIENMSIFGLWFLTYASEQASRQTDRQTDTLIAIRRPHTWAK